jgi:hypothetical protein
VCAVASAAALMALVAGCSPSGGSMGGFTVQKTVGEYCGMPDHRLALVVWIDEGALGSSAILTGDDPRYRGEFLLKDGRKVAWTCSTRDGRAGRVEIADVQCDLAKGGLFLISTKDGGTRVDQLPLDKVEGEFRTAKERLEKLASTDPQIKSFVDRTKDK